MIGWDIRSDEDNDDSNDGIVIIMTLIVMISNTKYVRVRIE